MNESLQHFIDTLKAKLAKERDEVERLTRENENLTTLVAVVRDECHEQEDRANEAEDNVERLEENLRDVRDKPERPDSVARADGS
jgi:predicted  nucleic acid-binding Zn-ribbon protein